MNRAFMFLSVVTLLVAGCGSSSNNNNTGGNGSDGGNGTDMSAAASSDMTMSLPPDMQPAYGCHALAACINAATDQASFNLCVSSSTSNAKQLYQAVTRCVRKICYPHPDAGPAPCVQGGGTQPPECTTCVNDSIKMTGSCGADTMYCGSCYSQFSACEANLP